MKKKIIYTTRGRRADIGPFKITRLVSNSNADHVGHFVFLDHIHPFEISTKQLDPSAAHPHRGIATLTYILNGEVEHFDSRGHRDIVYSGGVQWMKAGNGIIHNEAIGPDTQTGSNGMHGFQFWINLPALQKHQEPEYMALRAGDLPIIHLDNNVGFLKVVVGEFAGQASKIPTYAKQFLYHLTLKAGQQFSLPTDAGEELAVFLPTDSLTVNDNDYQGGNLLGFEENEGAIEFANKLDKEVELIVFGGQKYMEPFVAYGPFVMNTREEINEAYADYRAGKYGSMNYN